MIYLHTGLPGAGKTLYTLTKVRQRAIDEDRRVFYSGIELLKPELFPGWELLDDPAKWPDLPDGSILVHDEAQGLYRPRGNGSSVPRHVAEMETHRHKGLDLYFVTQHPMLIDSNVRRLAGEHVHMVRMFGSEVSTAHKWQQTKEQCDKSRADSIRDTFVYPKEIIGSYKSATVHTHKRKLPWKVHLLWALPVVGIVCVVGAVMWWKDAGHIESPAAATEQAAPGQKGGFQRAAAGGGKQHKTTAEWLKEQQPRIAGLPHTAPVFDAVTEPTTAPFPAACVSSASKCVCYTQQGTRLSTPEDLCRQIAETGYFVAWDTSGNKGNSPIQSHSPVQGSVQTAPARYEHQQAQQGSTASTWGGVPKGWAGIPPAS
jgi:hypothetical protein